MTSIINKSEIAVEIISILAKHRVPICMIDELFEHTREAVDSQDVESPNRQYDTDIKKPPLGLMPRWLSDESRLKEVNDAISRYIAVGKPIPYEWIDERNELEDRHNARKKPENVSEI